MKTPRIVLLASLALLLAAPASLAGRMTPLPFEVVLDPGESHTFESVLFKSPVFEIAPFGAHGEGAIPGFADPLGIGADAELDAFSGSVYHMDLLGDFTLEHDKDVAASAVPADALKGLDYSENLLTPIFNGKRRAFDPSLLNVKTAEVKEFMGLPVTSETSPLSLAGFGLVSEYLRPVRYHWTRCPAVEKRARVLEEIPGALRKKFKPHPATCFSL